MYKKICQDLMIKSIVDNQVIIYGYASVFNIIDYQNDIINKGAFYEINKNIKLLWQHNPSEPIGAIKFLQEDDYGLKIEASITNKTDIGRKSITLIQEGLVNGLSIGLNILESHYNKSGQRVITKANLLEVSIVTFPANSESYITNIHLPLVQENFNNLKENSMKDNIELHNNNISKQLYNIENQNKEDINNYQYFSNKINMLEKKLNNLGNMLFRPESENYEISTYKSAFIDYIRKGNVNEVIEKSLNSANANDGGVLVTPSLYNQIINNIQKLSPMRELASVETISSSNALDVILEDENFISGWVKEVQERPDTDNSKLLQKRIYVHELYAQPKATQSFLDDTSINIEQWLKERLEYSFAVMENNAFINGTGDGQPKGILHEDNKVREIVLEEDHDIIKLLLNLINDLDEYYIPSATFLMNRNTLSLIQNLKDRNDRFILQPDSSKSFGNTIFGIPVVCCNEIPNIEKNKRFIIFGDIKSAYKIVDRSGINIIRDPYTNKPFVKFYSVKRVGGDLIQPNALRFATIK